jgi:hypothetical protein
MTFTPAFIPPSLKAAPSVWFVFYQGKLLTKDKHNGCSIPYIHDFENLEECVAREVH